MNPSTPSTTDTLFTSGEIRYSQVWEDAGILSRGLEIQPSDHVLSIASAGCNALALLLEEPQSVTMVDLNPAQTALCHLKLAAKSKRLFDCHCIHLDHSFDCDRLVGCLVCRAARDHELF